MLSKLEFCRFESAATVAADLKKLTYVEEVLLNVVVVDDAVTVAIPSTE